MLNLREEKLRHIKFTGWNKVVNGTPLQRTAHKQEFNVLNNSNEDEYGMK